MLIIAGKLDLDPESRDHYLRGNADFIRRARAQAGCLDFVIAAGPVDPGRVNLFEHWSSEKHLAAWRAVADPPDSGVELLGDNVRKHQISKSGPAFE
jgi:quinol monooxygenase YgiN